MSALAGYGGQVLFDSNVVAELSDWTVTGNRDTIDTTAFQATPGFKTNLVGLADWSASVTGSLDMTDTNGQLAIVNAWLAGTVMTPKFATNQGTNYFSGTAFVTGLSLKVPVNGKQEFSATFKGNSTLAYT